jgi:hypothetical protein
MSKSVLVIDTPKHCSDCSIRFTDEYSDYCPCNKQDVFTYVHTNTKPNWCPLSPLPPHKDISHYIQRGDSKSMTHLIMSVHDAGYNQCLDDLQKGVTNER